MARSASVEFFNTVCLKTEVVPNGAGVRFWRAIGNSPSVIYVVELRQLLIPSS